MRLHHFPRFSEDQGKFLLQGQDFQMEKPPFSSALLLEKASRASAAFLCSPGGCGFLPGYHGAAMGSGNPGLRAARYLFLGQSRALPSLWRKYYLYFLEKGLRRRGQIITVTDFSKNRIQQLPGFERIPVHRVYPASGISLSTNTADKMQVLDFPYILHVGVLEKRKNLSLLIEAFALLAQDPAYADWKLILVGQRGPRKTLDDFDRLQELVSSLGLKEKVLFPGYVSEQMLASYFSQARIYVFPSANEGFGLPVLEAFSFGLPVIISKQGALKEVAGDAAWALESDTPEALKSAIVHLDRHPDLVSDMRQKGQKRLAEFGTEKFFLSLDHTFKKILHG
jgi:glycosyltransferase involved in cell wall biosynthesis